MEPPQVDLRGQYEAHIVDREVEGCVTELFKHEGSSDEEADLQMKFQK